MPNIITHLSPDIDIVSRYNEESARVHRWFERNANNGNFVPLPECVESRKTCYHYIKDGQNKTECLHTIGYIPWTSPITGDTWISILGVNSENVSAIHIYYWNTIGSIGFITSSTNFDSNGKVIVTYLVFSSHCMLRYRDRFAKSLNGVDLILYMYSRIGLFLTNYDEKRKEHIVICRDGIFISDAQDFSEPSRVVRIKTYLHWSDLPPRKRDKYQSIWQDHLRSKNAQLT